MRNLLPPAIVLVFVWASALLAATPAQQQSLQSRISQLEAETQALRGELQSLREDPVRLPKVQATPASLSNSMFDLQADDEKQFFTLEELQGEMKKFAWTKGDFKIVPYGYLWANMVYETERTYVGDYTLWAISAGDEGEDAFHVNAKSTRLGLNVAGPRLRWFNCAPSGGKIEFDFQGSYTVENKPGVLLRHAYWEVKNSDFRLLAGQTWDVVSPLLPGTIMYSVYWGAGNIGYRRPQFRAERYLAFSDTFLLTLQGSLNTDASSDFTTGKIENGDHSGWPLLEGRTAVTLGRRGKYFRPIVVGASGHIGEVLIDFGTRDDAPIRTWSFNVDLRAPITDRLGFQGEFFTGENLGSFLGGIVQGIDVPGQRPIRSTGGWMEIWYDLTSDLHTHVGYTIDDPDDNDVSAGGNGRTYNHAYWGNIVYDVTDSFLVGFEVGSWRTLYTDKRPGESVRFEFMARYGF
ncbi:MAG: hypothetical protein JXB62_03850 [Pirellulales bacterium]|nr:hypothetical protein [Pirellulales bacterium]